MKLGFICIPLESPECIWSHPEAYEDFRINSGRLQIAPDSFKCIELTTLVESKRLQMSSDESDCSILLRMTLDLFKSDFASELDSVFQSRIQDSTPDHYNQSMWLFISISHLLLFLYYSISPSISSLSLSVIFAECCCKTNSTLTTSAHCCRTDVRKRRHRTYDTGTCVFGSWHKAAAANLKYRNENSHQTPT